MSQWSGKECLRVLLLLCTAHDKKKVVRLCVWRTNQIFRFLSTFFSLRCVFFVKWERKASFLDSYNHTIYVFVCVIVWVRSCAFIVICIDVPVSWFCWNQIFIMIIIMTSSFACYLNSMPRHYEFNWKHASLTTFRFVCFSSIFFLHSLFCKRSRTFHKQ